VEKRAGNKLDHSAVAYEHPSRHSGKQCSGCVHYIAAIPPRCEGVKSPISPGDYCSHFERKAGEMAKLTAAERKKIPAKDFALGKGHYPIEDKGHARAALSRISANGTPAQKARVRARVHAKYPDIQLSSMRSA
jgi:hypothetical protein